MSNSPIYLQQDGYTLRAPEPEDLEVMYLFENTSSLWEVSNTTGPYSRYFLKQYIGQNKNDIYTDRQLRLMIAAPDRQVVGIIDLYNFDPFHNRAEVGIVIAEKYRSKGVGKMALQLLCEYSFNYLGIHQLYAYVDITNESCLRLFTGCDFHECAHLKDWMRTGKLYRDVKMMQRINSNTRN